MLSLMKVAIGVTSVTLAMLGEVAPAKHVVRLAIAPMRFARDLISRA